jgi:hypothetical protein
MSQTGTIALQQNGMPKGRGGKRPGAGRKPNYLKRLGIKAITAAEILAHHDEPELWKGLLTHKSPDVRLRTLQYLTDRRDGKAKQAVEVSGGLLHAHTAYRDPKLAAPSQEELAALDALTRKLALPAPDTPPNQLESNPAIEASDVGFRGKENVLEPRSGLPNDLVDHHRDISRLGSCRDACVLVFVREGADSSSTKKARRAANGSSDSDKNWAGALWSR